MAKISTQVGNRIQWARYVLASYRIHGARVEQTLEDQYPGGMTGTTMSVMAERLALISETMRQSELQLTAEMADDQVVRDRRKELVNDLRDALYRGDRLLEDAFGEQVAKSYGLANAPPRQADSLIAYAANVINLLEERPRSDTDLFGNAVDTTKVAAALSKLCEQLEETLEDLDTEQREEHAARADRDKIVDEWAQVYRGTAEVLSGMYLLAGRKDLADRVRPTVRKSSGKSKPPKDDEQPLGDIDEPMVDEPDSDDEPSSDDEPMAD